MCLFTCQTCKTTINQRETTTHECAPRADDAIPDAEVLAALNSLTGLDEISLRDHYENEVAEIRAALTAAKEARGHEHAWRQKQNVTTKGYVMPAHEACTCGAAKEARA